ncbi:unnamed protein product [Oppiella nova]|uniref:Biogenesis of lysosome-related organelles complex 1 subunit 5 n=1 Tax=Oppiella nova TaxID=334625 RepID=A0A7R9LUW9_9ACAR|nr:unnamed protein product [Oppiella nova]CAG2167170.1 unnamed protein product [Oppiella nova]
MSLADAVVHAFTLSDEVVNRLFVQKPFIFGEIRFLTKCFETRIEEDLKQLNECTDQLNDTKDTKIEEAIDWCHRFDDKLNVCTDSVQNLMQEILGLESMQSVDRNDVLRTKREHRNEVMVELIDISRNKINEVDAQHEEQEKQLRDYYKDLETKLKIIPNSSDH